MPTCKPVADHSLGCRFVSAALVVAVASCFNCFETCAQFKDPQLTGLDSGQRVDFGATLSTDLLEVYFVSWRADGNWDIWTAERASVDDDWADLVPLNIVNSPAREDSPLLSPDGVTLTFASEGLEGFGSFDLWQTRRKDRNSPWEEPVNLGPSINTRSSEGGATFSSDGLELIYDFGCCQASTLRRNTRESLTAPWSQTERMGRRNGKHQIGSAGYPSLSPDGRSIYFNANGEFGGNDIFVARRESLEEPFGPGENLGPSINTSSEDMMPRIASDGSLYYVRNAVFGESPWQIWRAEAETPLVPKILQSGDADQDLDFDQLDLVQVQIAGKYLSGQPATWGQGDWDGAPGGQQGSPPPGDGFFNQLDFISALAGGVYLTGPYAAVNPGGQAGDGQTSIVYIAGTGELAVDAPAGTELTSINIDSAGGIFTGDTAQNLGGSFDNDTDKNIFKATFGSSFGSLSFGHVAQTGLSEEMLLGDLSVVGSLAGGGDLGPVDLIYVPEPASGALAWLGLLGLAAKTRWRWKGAKGRK